MKVLSVFTLLLALPSAILSADDDDPVFVNPPPGLIRDWFLVVERREPTPQEMSRARDFFKANAVPPREDFSARKEAVGKFFQQVLEREPKRFELKKTMGFINMQENLKEVRDLKGKIEQALAAVSKGLGKESSPKAFGGKGKGGDLFSKKGGPGGGSKKRGNGSDGKDGEDGSPAKPRSGHGGGMAPDDDDEHDPPQEQAQLTGPAAEREAIREALADQVRTGGLTPSEAEAVMKGLEPMLAAEDAKAIAPERIASATFEALQSPQTTPSESTPPAQTLLQGLDQLGAKPPPLVSREIVALKPIPVPATSPKEVPATAGVPPPPVKATGPLLGLFPFPRSSADATPTPRPGKLITAGLGLPGADAPKAVVTGTGGDTGASGKKAPPAPLTFAEKIAKRAGDFVKKIVAALGTLRNDANRRRLAFQGPDGVSVLTRDTEVPGAPTPVPFAAIAAAEAEAKTRAALLQAVAASSDGAPPWDGIDWAFAAAILATLARIAWVLRRRRARFQV